jgi:hypothetical protein
VERVLAGDVGNEIACVMRGLGVPRKVASDAVVMPWGASERPGGREELLVGVIQSPRRARQPRVGRLPAQVVADPAQQVSEGAEVVTLTGTLRLMPTHVGI